MPVFCLANRLFKITNVKHFVKQDFSRLHCDETLVSSLPNTVHPLINECFIVYNKIKSISLRGGIMSICKEDLHLLVDLVNDNDTKLVYDLIRVVIEKDHGKENHCRS